MTDALVERLRAVQSDLASEAANRIAALEARFSAPTPEWREIAEQAARETVALEMERLPTFAHTAEPTRRGEHDDQPAVFWARLGARAAADALAAQVAGQFDFAAHLQRQREWSGRTFGPGRRTKGVVEHIRKELHEIEAAPDDTEEWIDVVILALDGAWRSGKTPEQIIAALVAKQTKNEGRKWPDWRTLSEDQAIEHDRSGDAHPLPAPDGRVTEALESMLDILARERDALGHKVAGADDAIERASATADREAVARASAERERFSAAEQAVTRCLRRCQAYVDGISTPAPEPGEPSEAEVEAAIDAFLAEPPGEGRHDWQFNKPRMRAALRAAAQAKGRRP